MESNSENDCSENVKLLRLVQQFLELPDVERSLLLRIIQHEALPTAGGGPEDDRLRQARRGLTRLSPSERRVIDRYSDGKGTGEIALEMKVSRNTVANFRKRAMAKMGAENLVDLVRLRILADDTPHNERSAQR